MRILISAYACTPGRGSEPGIGWHWALGNAMSGHEVWCFTTVQGKEAIQEALKQYPQFNFNFVFIDVPRWIKYLYRFQPFVYVHYLVWQYRAARAALELDRKIDFELVHHVTLASLQLGSGLWRLKKPLIFGPVGGGNFSPPAFRKYFGSGWFMEVLRQATSTLLLRLNPDFLRTMQAASLILATNTDTRRMAEKYGGKNVVLFLDTGIPAEFFRRKTERKRKDNAILKILWVGRIFARKGLPLVLEALSHVKKEIPFQLTILGDGKESKNIPGWLKAHGLTDRVHWRGQVPWEEAKKAFSEHDVFMFCSLRDSFGSQFLEAMAFGLPIITLNHQGAGDHIPHDAGIKVSVQDPASTVKELAEAVQYMYLYPPERERFGRNGTAFARQHQWDARIHEIQSYYKNITGKATDRVQQLIDSSRTARKR